MGEKEEVEEMRGEEEDKESGVFVSGLLDDFQEVGRRRYQVSLGCHQPHVLLLPRFLLLIPAPSLNSLSRKPLKPPLPSHSPQAGCAQPGFNHIQLSNEPAKGAGGAAKNPVSGPGGAGVVAGLLLVASSAGAGGTGQWPARVAATT